MSENTALQPHQWTNGGDEVMILRRIPKDRKTYNGFLWPTGVGTAVECQDWQATGKGPVCGGGLHGWPWGFGLGDGSDYDIINDVWLVIGAKPDDVIGELEKGWKCKLRAGTIRFEGTFQSAMQFVGNGFRECIKQLAAASGNASKLAASGYASQLAASGDDSKLAASGNDSQLAASGDDSQLAASGNDSKLAASGDDSKLAASGYASQLAASGNASQLAASGNDSVCAIAARGGTVTVGKRGAFALAYYTTKHGWRFVTGKVGEKGIKAGVAYTVNAKGRIVRAKV